MDISNGSVYRENLSELRRLLRSCCRLVPILGRVISKYIQRHRLGALPSFPYTAGMPTAMLLGEHFPAFRTRILFEDRERPELSCADLLMSQAHHVLCQSSSLSLLLSIIRTPDLTSVLLDILDIALISNAQDWENPGSRTYRRLKPETDLKVGKILKLIAKISASCYLPRTLF